MNQPEKADPVETMLREQNQYVNDEGFTARVMAGLPRRRSRAWVRPAVLLGAAAIGSVLAARWLAWGNLPPLDLSALVSLDFQALTPTPDLTSALMPWMTMLAVAASIVWAAVAAVQWDD
jgi:hypothetical protein